MANDSPDFVEVSDTSGRHQIINIRHIVRVYQEPSGWRVAVSVGENIQLDPKQADKLKARLPGLQ
jgi:hypothetical protein